MHPALHNLFDYAGLFPPARLFMQPAAENYARALMGSHADMLARFVCAASRLSELSDAASILMPGTHATSGYREHADFDPWAVTAVIDAPLEESLDAIDAFNELHAAEEHGLAKVDSIELKAESPGAIDEALDAIPEDLQAFFEIPINGDCRGFVAALAGNEAFAKIRCGGVTPIAFPTSAQIADFLVACRLAGVAYKATAGLHHPVRAEHRLTYDPDPPRGVMHGFVNLLLASALAHTTEVPREVLVEVLEETDAAAFALGSDSARWRDHEFDSTALARTRESFFLSIGSCSFDEPVEDLQQLGWL
ncbi:MAG: hypothetical protein H6811_01935 [Phycisphaeraceae bacterium]|nr:hypothetical protein [Phycisphaeraceae bacterium]